MNCNYFTCLYVGGIDSSITKQKIIYILQLKEGMPILRYRSIQSVNVVSAPRVVSSIEDAFK